MCLNIQSLKLFIYTIHRVCRLHNLFKVRIHRDVNETLRVAKPVFTFGAAAGPQTLEFVPKSSSWLPDQINHPDFRESQAITSDSSVELTKTRG